METRDSRLTRMISAALLCLPALAGGESPPERLPAADRTLTFTEIRSELVAAPLDLEGGWLELTPLGGDGEPRLLRLEDRGEEDGELRLDPRLDAGPVMLCSGGVSWAVTCERVYLEREVTAAGAEAPAVAVRFASGVAVRGRYRLDSWPVAGARVAVVPAGLPARRPYTLPLGPAAAGLMVREVRSDGEGRFRLPPLAAGDYFLETLLPSGRVHRGEVFALPEESAVRAATAADESTAVVWDLGDIDVAEGLSLEVRVRDGAGEPIAGARVAGRQGRLPLDYRSFDSVADGEGKVHLSGFVIDEPLDLLCQAPGHTTWEASYELLPVVIDCTLEPLAAVAGEVLAADGLAIADALVSVTPAAGVPAAGVPAAGGPAAGGPAAPLGHPVDDSGRFAVADLAPGEYLVTAAAPGFEAVETPFTLVAGDSLELGTIVLPPGRALAGRVVDAESGEPVAAAEIRALEPPGAAFAVTGGDGGFVVSSPGDRPLLLAVKAPAYAAVEVEVSPRRFAGAWSAGARSADARSADARSAGAADPTAGGPLVIELARGGWIRVLVWDEATGDPCRGCRLVVSPPGQELLTDRSGEALSDPLAEGYYGVRRPRLVHLGSTVISQGDGERRWVRVARGRVTTVRFGDWQESVRVLLPAVDPAIGAPAGVPPGDRGLRLSARTPWHRQTVLPEADGSFLLRRRRGVALELFLHLWDPLAGVEIEVWQGTLGADFAGEELVLPRPAGAIIGRARRGDAAVAGEEVLLRSVEGAVRGAGRTRGDGSFHLPYLPAGTYALALGDAIVRLPSVGREALDLGTIELLAATDAGD